MNDTLRGRLLVSVAIPLVLFFGLTIAGLDAIFRDLSRRSLEEKLNAELLAIVSTAETDASGRITPAGRIDEPRFQTPGSGLYAEIRRPGGEALWRSPSATGTFIDFGAELAPGERRIEERALKDGSRVAVASRGLLWQEGERNDPLVFSVASSLESYEDQLWRFRTQLFGWFIGLTLLLLATLAVLLTRVLAPVRRLEGEIAEVEAGTREQLGDGYPRELAGVTTNLNALLVGERRRVARYRDTLGNLAHSLKTPLAVMRSLIAARDAAQARGLDAEIDRMSGIVEHQLKRAAASGGALLGAAPVDLVAVAAELRATLLKVYARKDLVIENALPIGAQFVGDKGDVQELLGNLLDNACKWCAGRVRLSASRATGMAREGVELVVEDDGPGIPDDALARIGQRGVRADENTPGHGIGLAMVRDTVELYGGRFDVARSTLGGARIAVTLPGRI